MRHITFTGVARLIAGVVLVGQWNLPSVLAQGERVVQPRTAEDPTSPDVQAEPLPNVELPARTTKFTRSIDPYELEFFKADPMLFEQRFVTLLKFELPRINVSLNRPSMPFVGSLSGAQFSGWYFLETSLAEFGHDAGHGVRNVLSGSDPMSWEGFFHSLALSVPDEHRLTENMMNRLSQVGREGHIRLRNLRQSENRRSTKLDGEIAILTPTAEEGEKMARAMLTLLDYGLSRPSMAQALQARRQAQEELAELEASLVESQRHFDELEERLASDAEVSVEDLVTLKTQLHLLAVDVAGTEARIRATQKILEKLNAELARAEALIEEGEKLAERFKTLSSHVERVETIKISAEIDMASLEARRQTLREIIAQGRKRKQLERDLLGARQKVDQLGVSINGARQRIQSSDHYYVRLGPLRMHNNEVVIHPIRWRQPEGQ